GYIVRLEKKNGSNFKLTKNALKSVFQSIFCPNVNHLELLFNLFFLVNVPVLIPVTVFNPL
ncbi:TPA: hypothetical protein ACQXB1_001915, partial [Streptococcus pneumoniae]